MLGATALRVALLAPTYAITFAQAGIVKQVLQSMPDDEALQIAECAELQRFGVSPYQGTVCSTPPLLLWLYRGMSDINIQAFGTILIACDVLTGLLLWRLAQLLLFKHRSLNSEFDSPCCLRPSGVSCEKHRLSIIVSCLAYGSVHC